MAEAEAGAQVRLDVWLWAARFYRTRSLAKQAVETGKVDVAGQRAKPSRTLRVQIACNPCKRGCDAATCMRSIPEHTVLAAVRELLAGGGGHPVAAGGGHPVAAGGGHPVAAGSGRLVDCAGPRPAAQAEERPA